jgi:hypothetical protein
VSGAAIWLVCFGIEQPTVYTTIDLSLESAESLLDALFSGEPGQAQRKSATDERFGKQAGIHQRRGDDERLLAGTPARLAAEETRSVL